MGYVPDLTKTYLRSDGVCHRSDKTYLRSDGMVHRPDKTYFRSDGDMSQIWEKHILDLMGYVTDLTKHF